MRNKPNDKLYSGINEACLKRASLKIDEENFRLFVEFIKERYKIHKRKDVKGLPKPWTHDKILRHYKFTNVRREHDRETKWLINNITSNNELSYEDKILNCVLFRLYNKHETSEFIGQPIKFQSMKWKNRYKHLYQEFLEYKHNNPEYKFFTSAFYTSGMKNNLRQYTPDRFVDVTEFRVISFMKYLAHSDFLRRLSRAKSQRHAFRVLKSYGGIGDFLAYQIFVDLTYISEFPFSENEFTIAGCGCLRGLNYVITDTDRLSPEACIFWIRDHWNELVHQYGIRWDADKLFSDLPEYDRCMNVMSLENCFCEFSKYMKALNRTGRPKVKYDGG